MSHFQFPCSVICDRWLYICFSSEIPRAYVLVGVVMVSTMLARAIAMLAVLQPTLALTLQRSPALHIARPQLRRADSPALLVPTTVIAEAADAASQATSASSFSQTSFYSTLVLYVLAFPGVYSLVKRSVKSKVVRKVYEVSGPAADDGRPTREVAGDIVAFFQ
eukprot:6189422-Pleurochrysis_carterae.AAC.1